MQASRETQQRPAFTQVRLPTARTFPERGGAGRGQHPRHGPPRRGAALAVGIVTDGRGRSTLARYHDNAGGRSLEELHVDTAGYPHQTGKTRAIANVSLTPVAVWTHLNKHYQQPYRGEEDIDDTPEVRQSIIGPVTTAFPLNEGWYAKGQTPRKDDDEPRDA